MTNFKHTCAAVCHQIGDVNSGCIELRCREMQKWWARSEAAAQDSFQFIFRDLPCSDQRSHQGARTPEPAPARPSQPARPGLLCTSGRPQHGSHFARGQRGLTHRGGGHWAPAHLRSVPSQQNPAGRDLEKTRREEPCTLWKKQMNSRPPPNTLDMHVWNRTPEGHTCP